MDIDQAIEVIEQFMEFDGYFESDRVEFWSYIITLWQREDYIKDRGLANLLLNEIIEIGTQLKRNYRIVEEEVTVKEMKRVVEYMGNEPVKDLKGNQ